MERLRGDDEDFGAEVESELLYALEVPQGLSCLGNDAPFGGVMKISALVILGIVSLVFLAGCGSNGGLTDGRGLITGVTISPSSATVQAGGVQQFTATVTPSGASQAVTWSVSGAGCTGASCGTIDASGKYTAPATVPNPAPVTITARSVVDATYAATATVTINTATGNTGSAPISVAVAPDPSGKFGKFVYVANYRSNKISMYIINPTTGALTSIGTIDAGLSPSSIAIDPSGRFAYVTNAGDHYHAGDVSMYTIDATTGALTSAGTVVAGISPGSVAVHPSGKFAYVVNRGDYVGEQLSLSMYTIDATSGVLTPTGTIDTDVPPVSVAVDPSGRFAYVAGVTDSLGGNVSMYTVDATTGALRSIGGLAAGIDATSVVVDPSGKFVYAATSGYDKNGDVFMYTIDPATGALTSIGTAAAGGHATSVAVHPSGSFAYVANCLAMTDLGCWTEDPGSPGSVSMYTIDSATGALTSVGTIAAGSFPSSIAIDPSGKFAYVANFRSNSVSMYSIDAATGALTLIGTIGV